MNLVTASPDVPTARALADRLRARCPHVASVVVLNVNPKKAAVAVGVEEHPIAGNETIRERLGGLTFLDLGELLLPDQHAAGGAPVRHRAGVRGAQAGRETVFDLYSGTGAISLLLARQARAVYGIELVPAAIEDARGTARRTGSRTARSCRRGAARAARAPRRGVRADVVVADPPRAGFHPKASPELVSARRPADRLRLLQPGDPGAGPRRPVRAGLPHNAVQPVDMFPHTPHIEVVARLTRRN